MRCNSRASPKRSRNLGYSSLRNDCAIRLPFCILSLVLKGESGMAERQQAQPSRQQAALQVEDSRNATTTHPNNPPTAVAAKGRTPPVPWTRYVYSLRLDPALRDDPSGRAYALPPPLETQTWQKLTAKEAALLAEELRRHEPWLASASKGEAMGACRLPWRSPPWRSISRACEHGAGWIDGHEVSFLEECPAVPAEIRVSRNTPDFMDEKGL